MNVIRFSLRMTRRERINIKDIRGTAKVKRFRH